MTGCQFPQHHKSGSGFPWVVAVVVTGAVIVLTSGAFASIVHDVMVMVLAVCAVVLVLGAGGLWVLAGRVARTGYVPPRQAVVVPPAVAARRADPLPVSPDDRAQIALGRAGRLMVAAERKMRPLPAREPVRAQITRIGPRADGS